MADSATSGDVDGLQVMEIDCRKYATLSGRMDAHELAEFLVSQWVPYVECDECGRYHSCRFSTANPGVEAEYGEIRCGVTRTALYNLVTRTFGVFQGLSKTQRQDYLVGAFHYTRFVHDAEQMVGMQISDPHLDYWASYIPLVFGQLAGLRRHLDDFAEAMRSIPDFNTVRDVLLVEGWAEKVLFDRLRTSGISWFTRLRVETYEGRASRGPARLQLLINHFHETGYRVCISGDADGGALNVFDGLIGKGLVARERTHVFTHDFETGVPPSLLYLALRKLNLLEDVPETCFCLRLADRRTSVIPLLKSGFAIDIEPLKLKLADAIGMVMASIFWPGWKDSQFDRSELGQLLELVKKMNA